MNKSAMMLVTVVWLAVASFVGAQEASPVAVQQATERQSASSGTETLSEILKKRAPNGVLILENISVTSPDPSVQQELVWLSGAWVGEWRGERTNALMIDHVYVFEKVSNTSVTVVSMGVGRFSGRDSNYGETWSNRYVLKPEETSPLTVVLPNGNKITFQVRDGQLMKTRSVRPNGSVNVGIFKKIL